MVFTQYRDKGSITRCSQVVVIIGSSCYIIISDNNIPNILSIILLVTSEDQDYCVYMVMLIKIICLARVEI